ncbi:Acyl-coenzyme A thioesterase 5 [Armadillidium vulgare]|nr:Acyl-coenzyme A thioesterase 5 [Armadillidium vulgare]
MGGSFRGVFQMGPIGCLKPGPETFKYYRYINLNVPVPMTVKFTVLKGHLEEKEAYKLDESLILDSAVHERIYLAEGTKRIVVREGRIRGTLFIPAGDGPFPGVVDIFGGSGSLFEFRAAQFAARGIAALALAFYDYDDIPVDIPELDIDYFHEAVKYLLKHEKVKKPNVAVIGLSKGCDLAFSLATFIPEVKAAICINGLSVNLLKPMRVKDKIILAFQTDISKIKIVKYEGGGHLLESPYAPFAGASFHRVVKKTIIWGGNAYQHIQASEDAWKRSMEFIRKHIT